MPTMAATEMALADWQNTPDENNSTDYSSNEKAERRAPCPHLECIVSVRTGVS